PVAQLDRALPSEGRGHRFESCRVRHFSETAVFQPFLGSADRLKMGTRGRNWPSAEWHVLARRGSKPRVGFRAASAGHSVAATGWKEDIDQFCVTAKLPPGVEGMFVLFWGLNAALAFLGALSFRSDAVAAVSLAVVAAVLLGW